MGFVIVVPARYGSSRLPGKPLVDIGGKPLIWHVHARAVAAGADEVVIATDDVRIADVARGFGAIVCMTSSTHPSGTDRLAEVVAQRSYAADRIIVNLQGDEPLMPAVVLQQVAKNLADKRDAVMATVCEVIADPSQLFAPSVVKVVMDHQGYALYFSRAPIPWDRDGFAATQQLALSPRIAHYRHIGLYAYRAGFLREYVQWEPAPVEQAEALEQLRVLWRGYRIHVAEAEAATQPGVDTPEDLERVRRALAP